jgi:hypothetical protein
MNYYFTRRTSYLPSVSHPHRISDAIISEKSFDLSLFQALAIVYIVITNSAVNPDTCCTFDSIPLNTLIAVKIRADLLLSDWLMLLVLC